MQETIHTLTYAVRPRVVLKYSGQLSLMLSLLTLVPLAVALFNTEWLLAQRYALICGVLLIAGITLARLPTPTRIQGNEALSITALAFIISPLLMSWPMMAADIAFIDAWFEALSGVTTTGLSALGSVEQRSATFLFSRAWMQWYGGLGIVILSVALLMGHHAATSRLVEPVESGERFVSTARSHARHSLLVYLGLTLLGLALVWPLSGNGFDALLHVLSAVSTGGFSSYDNSLAQFGPDVAIAIMVIAFLSAVSLPLYWRVIHAGWLAGVRNFLGDIELRALFIACLIAGILLSLLAWFNHAETPWYHGLLMGLSAQTTTGYTTMQVAELDPVSKLVMILSMLIGGSVGSSAGGFKLLRLLIFLRMLQIFISRAAMPPHAVSSTLLAGQKLDDDDIQRALQLILLFIAVVFLSWLPFVALGYDPLDALFEVVSACGTVGLSTGITRPELEPALKAILCFDMLAGRLEIIALLVVLYPRNWIGRREEIL
ncbi:MAG: potassium transporter TrkG [Thioalkalispiraceae bacterium]|jgi:trk system potassium uptake protein TrkH